ncbi:rCG51623 [Rattus norvegicus]|uniref:RCG51623 n=1 Tax=Rattus norvegicus TaxID=10116 RepID=A6IZ28_RAT|nr:rCG51623 [Rattus norvegicus]
MLLQRPSWLWLYLRISVVLGVLLGREPSIPEQHGKNSCYQLNRLYCSFHEAEMYCHAQRGHLANTWNPKLQDFLQNSPQKETVWWVGINLKLPRKQPGITQTGAAAKKPDECTSVVKRSNAFFPRWDQCLKKHHFICQAVAVPPQGANIWRNELDPWKPMKKRGAELERHMIPGDGPPLSMCHPPAPPELVSTVSQDTWEVFSSLLSDGSCQGFIVS